MALLQILAQAGLTILIFMTSLWVVSLIRKDASIVDIFWGLGFILTGAVYFRLTDGFPARKALVMALVAVWGFRLALHIFSRNLGKGEDKRYQVWRMGRPKNFWWISYFQVFLLQGILMLLISTPLLSAQIAPEPDHLTVLDMSGALLWAIGFFFEAIGDWQLTRFKADPGNKGKVLQTGLWRYSRHPNYFGEAALWWGYFVIALGVGGYWTLYSPILMTILLLRVSGVTLLEKSLTKTRPEYQAYIERTSAFIPWFPREETSKG
jgi:steroid 5-alpha reductase family enzyme